MPKRVFRKKSTDKKQTKRIKQLEQFVYKTIENKQINYQASNINIDTGGTVQSGFLQVLGGVEDGTGLGSRSRIGNSVTLMRQALYFNLKLRSGSDDFNQMRVIVVSSTEGSQGLILTDVLEYGSYALFGDMVFASNYTTKTSTNKRYRIHMDKTLTLTKNTKPASVLKHVINYKGGKLITFDGPLSQVSVNHRLQFFVISDSGAIQHPQLDYAVRSTYKDA